MIDQKKKPYEDTAHEFAAYIQRELSLTPNEAMHAMMAMTAPAPMKDKYTTSEIRAIDDKIVKLVDGDDKTQGLNDDEQATLYKFLRARGWTEEKAKIHWNKKCKD